MVSTVTKGRGSTLDLNILRDYTYQNIHVYYSKSSSNPLKSMKIRGGRYNVLKRLISKKKLHFDVIHAHFGASGEYYGVRLKALFNVPLITFFYGSDAYLNTVNANSYLNLSKHGDLFVVLSNHMKEKLIQLGFPTEKIAIVRIGVDCKKFDFSITKNSDNSQINLLLIANFVEKKGILDAINAFAIASKKVQNLFFTIVGDGPLKEDIQNLILTSGLTEKIQILDNIHSPNPRGMVLEELEKADIFILPSKTASNGDCEGTPVVLMEASASGLPCITTKHSGNPEVVIHGKTGLISPEGDIQSLANSIIELSLDNEKRTEFGSNARNFIFEKYNKINQRKNLLELYEKIFSS